MQDYFATVIEGYRSENNLSEDMLEKLPLFIDMVLVENIVDECECCRIYEVCNHLKYSVNDYHFMFLEEYENTPKDQLHKAYTYQGRNSFGQGANKKVRCVTTNELFDCISDACEKYLGSRKNDGRIAMCCNGKRKYVGKLADGTKLVWEWIE